MTSALAQRVHTSRLIGQDPSLVLHGGGNTSVKVTVKNFFGESEEILYIKGSGWDLATITEAGFAPVKMNVLLQMAQLKDLTDTDMVLQQRAAMLNPNAPNPSVEAILHAIIPFTFVDHTHADVIATITNTPNGEKYIHQIYGDKLLVVPYVMPGFVLARRVYEMTRTIDWQKYEGIVLLNHGLFSFANSAKESYEKHLRLVKKAEAFLKAKRITLAVSKPQDINLLALAQLRRDVSMVGKKPVIALLNNNPQAVGFSKLKNIKTITQKGTLTPDHVIRTKPTPVIISDDITKSVGQYTQEYCAYFNKYTDGKKQMLDVAPRWGVWPSNGIVTFGHSMTDAQITADIVMHTIPAIQYAKHLGGWQPIKSRDIFEMEYWSLEQAKLKKSSKALEFQGKIALVTGAASGIGRACVEALLAQGACVAALDINPAIETIFNSANALGIPCDVTDDEQLTIAINTAVRAFGGLDVLVSNAGIFPPSQTIEQMNSATWDKSVAINLTSHQRLLTKAAPFLALGIDPAVILIASKNVPAPGPGASAYSVAKAGLTQLARVAALELGQQGIRVNVVHPNQVFDTAIWTPEVLTKRAKNYGMSIQEYKTNNILHTTISSHDVANLVASLASKVFSKTTGAQIPIDGGNDRVI